MDYRQKALLIVLALNAILVAVCVPLLLRRVPPNVVLGFRTRATLSNESLWYEVNALFAKWSIALTIVSSIAFGAISLAGVLSPENTIPIALAAMALPSGVAALVAGRHSKKPLQ